MEEQSIALDGPAGAGKSTLARSAALHFGLIYVDTGALYRSVGLFASRRGISSTDEEGVASLLPEIELEMFYDDSGVQRMQLNDEDVTDSIRLPEMSICASNVSAMPSVRDFLLSMQRGMASKYNVIMDGRDIGTVVLPNAGLKVFLTAELSARAERRYLELRGKSIETTLEDVTRDMALRDKNDSERKTSPLKAADGAVILDTTELNLEESITALCRLIADRFRI